MRNKLRSALQSVLPRRRNVALLSYLKGPLELPDDDPLTGHSNAWESREIAHILDRLGFAIDAIDWTDHTFQPRKNTIAVIDINDNLQRMNPRLGANTRRLLHMTGSYPPFNVEAGRKRAKEFERRGGMPYTPKRARPADGFLRSLDLAHYCSLLGNEQTLKSYPPEMRGKITLIPASGSILSHYRAPPEMAPSAREFLWFGGPGAVHKGLDLVLDVFSRRKELILHVAGLASDEADFMAAYGTKLSGPNIRNHGWIDPLSDFHQLFKDVFCFIAPSCAEGSSTAVITCLHAGLLPIISRPCGVDLPPGYGFVLEDLAEKEIEGCVDKALALSDDAVIRHASACQAHARRQHSRDAFSNHMTAYLGKALAGCERKVGWEFNAEDASDLRYRLHTSAGRSARRLRNRLARVRGKLNIRARLKRFSGGLARRLYRPDGRT
jgi:glycosyltransferase involved in cell wall biosynthesis